MSQIYRYIDEQAKLATTGNYGKAEYTWPYGFPIITARCIRQVISPCYMRMRTSYDQGRCNTCMIFSSNYLISFYHIPSYMPIM